MAKNSNEDNTLILERRLFLPGQKNIDETYDYFYFNYALVNCQNRSLHCKCNDYDYPLKINREKHPYLIVEKDGNFGVIETKNCELVAPCCWKYVCFVKDADGVVLVSEDASDCRWRDGYLYDLKTGRKSNTVKGFCSFDEVRKISNTILMKRYSMDEECTLLQVPSFEVIGSFASYDHCVGIMFVQDEKTEKWGVVDLEKGEMIITPVFNSKDAIDAWDVSKIRMM